MNKIYIVNWGAIKGTQLYTNKKRLQAKLRKFLRRSLSRYMRVIEIDIDEYDGMNALEFIDEDT